jgi:hypothetical protein
VETSEKAKLALFPAVLPQTNIVLWWGQKWQRQVERQSVRLGPVDKGILRQAWA